ncbi:MAG: hypothetical protein RKO66_05325 [Candidatus Contendobacter sp.]|nr:hypothetical protein [Candidatus Contendobacter sp.]
MTEQTPQDLLQAMSALLQQTQAPLTAQPQGLGLAAPAGGNPIKGIAVPVKIKIGGGSLRTYVALGAEAVASQAAFNAALEAVERIVGPLDIWESREDSGLGGSRYSGRGGFRR